MQDFPDEIVLQQRRKLREMAQGFRQAQILLSCVELGVFEALNGCQSTATEVAQAVGADPRGVALLLNAATSLDLLEKKDERFSNKALVEACLMPDVAGTMARSIKLQATFYHRWGRLAEAVRTGRRPEENRRDEQPEPWIQDFVHGIYNMARPIAPAVAEALALPEDRPLRAIDVGGCHGAYSMALARRYPLLTATVFELPRVVPVAREIIAQTGLAERVKV
jgi:hypothetical protein